MVGIGKELVVDEIEITVGEWLDYIYYQDQLVVNKYISRFVSDQTNFKWSLYILVSYI